MAYEKVSGSSSSSPRTPHPRAQPNGDKDSFTWFQDVRITPRFENQEPPSHFEKWIGKSHGETLSLDIYRTADSLGIPDSHDTNETRSLFGSPMSFFGRMEGGKICMSTVALLWHSESNLVSSLQPTVLDLEHSASPL